MPAIARELNCTTGVVTHYFRDNATLTELPFSMFFHPQG